MDVRVNAGDNTVRIPDATAAEVLALVRKALDNPTVTQIKIEVER